MRRCRKGLLQKLWEKFSWPALREDRVPRIRIVSKPGFCGSCNILKILLRMNTILPVLTATEVRFGQEGIGSTSRDKISELQPEAQSEKILGDSYVVVLYLSQWRD